MCSTVVGHAQKAKDLIYNVVQEFLENRSISWTGGAACVTRTRDPIITNDVLYRLS